jgi:hypothetical protein
VKVCKDNWDPNSDAYAWSIRCGMSPQFPPLHNLRCLNCFLVTHGANTSKNNLMTVRHGHLSS